jgi:hypothetical protein
MGGSEDGEPEMDLGDEDLTDIPAFLDRRPPKEDDISDDMGDQPVPNASSSGGADDVKIGEAPKVPSMTTDLKAHPYADMFPMMKGKDFAALVASIRKDGLEEPIVNYENQILDGRNRFAACAEAEVEPTFEEYEDTDPLAYVLRKNLHRRQLQTSQRAMIAARMANLKQGGDHKSKDFKASNDGLKIADIAKILSVSPKTVERAKAVLDNGDEELIEAVESGKVTASAAAKKITAAKKPATKTKPFTIGEVEAQRLLKLWDKTGIDGRARFLEGIGANAND